MKIQMQINIIGGWQDLNEHIKMIVTDLDGTFLRTDKTVSDRNRLALMRCQELGIKMIFATGRSPQTKVVSREWFDGCVCCNGAYAYDGELLVYKRKCSSETTNYLLEACRQHSIYVEPRQDEEIYLTDISPEEVKFIESILPADLYLIVLKSSGGQIMHNEAKKSKAVEALSRHWGIAKSETVAFGDELNDIDLLSSVGIGIAMGNAADEVAVVANEVCLKNDEDGFAVWIEKNILRYRT